MVHQEPRFVLSRIPSFLQPETEALNQGAHNRLRLLRREPFPDTIHGPMGEAEERSVVMREHELVVTTLGGRG